jgi:membrane associated rhomboid family serine protease
MVYIFEWAAREWVFTTLALKPATVLLKPWTLVTSMFVHADVSHLLFNMISLLFFGLYLERLLGEKEFLKIYFIGGVFASVSYVITSLLFGIPHPNVYGVGASGAIFAIMGTLVVLRPNMTILYNFLFPMPLYVWVILYTVIAVPSMFAGGPVAHNAHLGGLLAGYFFGKYYKPWIPEEGGGTYGYRFY